MDVGDISAECLKNVLDYDPLSGEFTWKARMGKRGVPGKRAGTVDFNGYVVVTINRKRHKAHRLAWLYMYGKWPDVAIDHINGVKADNRASNLRQADWAQNQHNRTLQRNNKTGYMGVSWSSATGKWHAGIRVGGKSRNLGAFDSPERAHEAYLAAKATLHPFQPVPRYA